MFKVKIDDSEIKPFFASMETGLGDDNISRILEEAAAYIDFKIMERTSQGIDVDSKPFKPYAPMTVRLRRKAGLPTNNPDLFFTGQMLNAMTHESTTEEGRVFFMGGISSPTPTEKMQKNNPTFPFFGVSEEDIVFVQDLVDKEVDKMIDG